MIAAERGQQLLKAEHPVDLQSAGRTQQLQNSAESRPTESPGLQ